MTSLIRPWRRGRKALLLGMVLASFAGTASVAVPAASADFIRTVCGDGTPGSTSVWARVAPGSGPSTPGYLPHDAHFTVTRTAVANGTWFYGHGTYAPYTDVVGWVLDLWMTKSDGTCR